MNTGVIDVLLSWQPL